MSYHLTQFVKSNFNRHFSFFYFYFFIHSLKTRFLSAHVWKNIKVFFLISLKLEFDHFCWLLECLFLILFNHFSVFIFWTPQCLILYWFSFNNVRRSNFHSENACMRARTHTHTHKYTYTDKRAYTAISIGVDVHLYIVYDVEKIHLRRKNCDALYTLRRCDSL